MNYVETINSNKNKSENQFRERGTYAWAKSLFELQKDLSDQRIEEFYQNIPINMHLSDPEKDNLYKEIFLSFEFFAALAELSRVEAKINVRCIAIVCWYYSIYHAAAAMIIAQTGKLIPNHTKLANEFHTVIVKQKHIMFPFDLKVNSLESYLDDINAYASEYGCNTKMDNKIPTTEKQYNEWLLSYLKGTCDKQIEKVKGRILEEEKDIIENFRTKKAKVLKNERLRNKPVSFLHEAFRYRGKANYEDELYLAMSNNNQKHYEDEYIEALLKIAHKFLRISALFCSHKIGQTQWDEIISSFKENSILTHDISWLKVVQTD